MLTFEEWRHTYADVFETDDAARAAWTAASNNGYRAGAQDTRALLTAHSAGVNGMTPERRFHFANRMIHIDDLEDRIALVRAIERELLAAHSAGAQEPVAWAVYNGWCKIAFYMSEEGARDHAAAAQRSHDLSGSLAAFRAVPLYAQPQPMPQTDASRHLSDLLARIHRDGGHYETQYGTEKATADAEMKVAQLNEMTDAARDAAYAKLRQPFARLPYEALTSIRLEEDWSDARERLAYARRVAEAAIRSCEIQLQQRIIEIERLDRSKGE